MATPPRSRLPKVGRCPRLVYCWRGCGVLKPDSPLYIKPSAAPGFVKFMVSMARHCNAGDFRSGLRTQLRLAADAADLLDDYVADGIEFEMHRRGALLAFETRERFEEHCRWLPIFEEFGMVPELLDHSGVHAREPALSYRINHGLLFQCDRQIEPDSLTRGLVKRCETLGVRIVEHSRVERFLRAGDALTGVVTADGGNYDGDVFVLAAGVWSGPLSTKTGVPMPIRPGKGYSIDYSPAPVELRTTLTLEDARVAVTPLNGMVRLAGTMEFGGFDEAVNTVRVDAIRRAAMSAFTDWGRPSGEAAPWAGLRPMTPDGLPIIGRLGPLRNAFIASGHGMLGLTLAPGTAEIITDMVLHQRMPLAAAAVSPDRFLRRRARR